jgi:hypothetical protein
VPYFASLGQASVVEGDEEILGPLVARTSTEQVVRRPTIQY